MILSELRDYIRAQRRVILNDLIIHFNVDAEALRGMLSKLVSKGKVKKTSAENNCGTSCCKCDPAMTEIYEWNDESLV
jgi:putative ferrous iron transport protein C